MVDIVLDELIDETRVAIGIDALVRETVLVVPVPVVGVALFYGVDAMLGSLADSQKGANAATNANASLRVFPSEAFVARTMLPGWLPVELSSLTYFCRGVRTVPYREAPVTGIPDLWPVADVYTTLLMRSLFALCAFVGAARMLPGTD